VYGGVGSAEIDAIRIAGALKGVWYESEIDAINAGVRETCQQRYPSLLQSNHQPGSHSRGAQQMRDCEFQVDMEADQRSVGSGSSRGEPMELDRRKFGSGHGSVSASDMDVSSQPRSTLLAKDAEPRKRGSEKFHSHHSQDGQQASLGTIPESGTSSSRKKALEVEIIRGIDLMASDWALFGEATSDPYCHCEVEGKPHTRQTTSVIDKNLNPEWNQVFIFEDYESGDALNFEVWDKDYVPLKSDDPLGKARLDAKKVKRNFEGEIPLEDVEDPEKQGKSRIFVKVRVIKFDSRES